MKSKFWTKYISSSKIEILVRNRNFPQKSKFWQNKIEISSRLNNA